MNNKNNKSQTHHKDQTQEQNESEVNIDKVNSKKTTSNSELEDTALINTDEIAAKITAEKESLTLNKDTKDTKDTKNNTQDDPKNQVIKDGAAVESQPKPTTRKSKKVPLIICGVIAAAIVIPAVCFGTYVNSYDKVYPNVYVGETNIGGQTAENAANTLNNIYTADKLQDKKIKLSCKEANSEIAIKNLSIHFDNTKTTSDAFSYGRSGNIFMRMYDYLMFSFGRHEVSPSMKYDEQALTGAINDIAKPYEVEPIGYTHKIDTNKLTLYKSVDGIKVNRELVTNQIESEILSFTFNPITLEPVVTSPPKLDFDEFYAYVTSDAKNASYEKVDGHVVVKPGKLKCEIDKESVNSAIIELEGGTESFEMVAKTTPPAVTSEMLTADLYSETLGSYNSDFGGSSAPRANNVRLASKKMNGTELMPGEVFSYNNIVGERSRANGFQAAPVFVGNKVESGLGGGVCQPSSTLYSAVLYANLEIVERNQHSLSVSYMPGGMDATVSYGSLDFRFKNNTPYPVKVLAIPDGGTLKCSILGYNPEKTSVQIVRSSNGSSFYVTRIVKKDGVEVSREKMPSSTYGVLEKSDPKKPN